MSADETGNGQAPPFDGETYRQERRLLIDGEFEQNRLFDRTIVTLAAGALGLSLAFIQEVTEDIEPATAWWLYTAWAGFIASLLSTLISFLVSVKAFENARDILDAVQRGSASIPSNCAASLVEFLNWSSLLLFVGGGRKSNGFYYCEPFDGNLTQ